MSSLAKRIRILRKERWMFQETLAHRAGLSLSLINKIERGVVPDPHYSTLVRIATALGMSTAQLLEGVDE